MFPDCNASLNSLMVLKWCTKLEIAYNRCPVVFQGHLSEFKVTQDKKLPILTQIKSFRTVTPVWIHWWFWNDAWSSIEEVPYYTPAQQSCWGVYWFHLVRPSVHPASLVRSISLVWVIMGRRGVSQNAGVLVVFSCDQAALWRVQSVCPSVIPFSLCSYHRIIMKFSGVITNNRS